MKKRILSILLAVLMIVPMFTFATTVSAADETTWYSYDFEDRDIRNYAAGQVLDLGVVGEAAVEPKLDGEIGDDEYQHQTTFPRLSNVAKAPANMPVWYAVKGEYLYVAFANFAEEKRQTIQYEMTVMGNHMSYSAWNRISAQVTASGALAGGSTTFGVPSLNAYVSGSCGYYPSNFIKGWAWSDGVYEVKMDIGFAYRFFAGSPSHDGVWESPVIGFFFWYDVDNKGGVGQTQYAYAVSGAKIDCARTVGWVPKSIILPKTTHESVQQYKGVIGELGFDQRYAVESQTAFLNSEIATAPVADGAIGENEYSATKVHEQDLNTAFGDITGYYAVKDGYVYAAFQYADASARNCIVQYGLIGSNGSIGISRVGATIKPDGTCSYQGHLIKNAAAPNDWTSIDGGKKGNGSVFHGMTNTAFSHNDGITTIEMRVAIPLMAAALMEAGWDAENTNAVSFLLFPDSSANIGKKINTVIGTSGDAVNTQIRKTTGVNYHAGYVVPTVALPKGYTEAHIIEDVDDLGNYGQKHLYASPSVVTLDGKIGAGEYTAVESYTAVRTGDTKAQPDLALPGTNYNYFAYDEEYIYIGATVYDPDYKSNTSMYQFNISVLNKDDNKVDMGDGVKRLNWGTKILSDGTVSIGNYSGVWRCQKDAENKYPGESDFSARIKNKKPLGAGSYDAETKTLTYEFAVKISELKECLAVTGDIDNFQYLNYLVLGNGKAGFNFVKTNDSTAIATLKALTAIGNAGTVNYSNDFFKNVVHIDDVAKTRDSASARISNTAAGLRFKSHFTNEYLAYMANYAEAKGETMEIGTLIAPADYIKGEFTHAALGKGNYVEVMADVDTPFSNANGVTTIAGSLVNIKEANLDRDFAGIGFIKIGNEYFYTDNYTVKNISEIASAALADTNAVSGNGYNYKVSEGVYSPYSEGQRNILNTLIAK